MISANLWLDQPCVIVGGGPSLRSFPWWLLKNYRVIGINKAGEALQCEIHFGIDRSYWKRTAPGYGCAVWVSDDDPHPPPESVDVTLPHRGDLWDLTPTVHWPDGIARGGHSGCAALHLAFLLGANPIYLLGYDCRGENGRTAHWHKGYHERPNERIYRRFAESVAGLAAWCEERGREVVVVDPSQGVPSRIEWHRRAPWEVLV